VTKLLSTACSLRGTVFSSDIVSDLPGVLTLRFTGPSAMRLFGPESGGHRWQRTPPTEKRGRTQTSSVTVAVLPETSFGSLEVSPSDVREDCYIGSGPGGQHRNKTASAIRLTHLPTGLVVTCENERSQGQNRRQAWSVLQARLSSALAEQRQSRENGARREQIGTGYRGDKIRTVQMQNDRVTNHLNGRKCSAKRYLKGDLEAIQ
jgi:peptide chain release factor 1